ncbi:hypothetical protein RJ640_019979 [Escallonia rubra]|uniref:H15 domain-containing protein n=1 Tax=Escallonia rubra TaxID=112253 RepID=A0AA88Q7W1_9ASTE|nr:hypothetical protein RJ640_019979 [Escallonia rubra]
MVKAAAAMALAKKKSTAKPTDPPSSTLHPPYFQMISEAISSLKDRTGSSQPAIAKFIEEKYQNLLPPNFKKVLSVQLKKFVKSEKLVKVKNSYKIAASEKVKIVAAAVKVTHKTKDVKKVKVTATNVPKNAAKKVLEKAVKTKRLSQVKTPEALKKKKASMPPKRKAVKPVKA